MRRAPKDLLKRMVDIEQAWSNLRPTKSFAGMTLDQYRERIKPSKDARDAIAADERKLAADVEKRVAADEVSSDVVSRVVNGVRADEQEGEDGELYATMGFVRKSHRSTRRRRAKTNGAAGTATAKPQDGEVSS